MAIRLEMAFKPSAESWLRMQGAYDLWQARQHTDDLKISAIGNQAA
ncbi:hypothetical protein KAI87_02060 [Myxococcota bacterium]|nr:hypothetical protein [Myxococcota bacterium]